MLLLLDAAAGILLADPDPVAIAQYQAEAEHLAPKRRFFLEDVHLPAQTLDGHMIQVIAITANLAEVENAALTSGADALYVPSHSELLDVGNPGPIFAPDSPNFYETHFANAPKGSEQEQGKRLSALIEAAKGKPLVLCDDYDLRPVALVEAAAKADLTIIRAPEWGFAQMGIGELADELALAQADCQEIESACGLPSIGAWFGEASAVGDKSRFCAPYLSEAQGRSIFYVPSEINRETPTAELSELISAVAAAQENAITLTYETQRLTLEEAPDKIGLSHLIGAGVSSVIVPSHKVSEAKSLIRSLSVEDCRAEVDRIIELSSRIG